MIQIGYIESSDVAKNVFYSLISEKTNSIKINFLKPGLSKDHQSSNIIQSATEVSNRKKVAHSHKHLGIQMNTLTHLMSSWRELAPPSQWSKRHMSQFEVNNIGVACD